MQPIQGLKLNELAIMAEEALRKEDVEKIKLKIMYVIGRNAEALGSIKNLEKQLVKAKERLAKEQAKLEAVRSGDWSVLEEEKPTQEEKGEQK